jgi:hypothetical protein
LVTSCKISKNNATQDTNIKIQANIVPSLVSFEIELEEVAIVRNTQRVRKPKIAPATCPAIGHELAAEKKFNCSCDFVALRLLEMGIG